MPKEESQTVRSVLLNLKENVSKLHHPTRDQFESTIAIRLQENADALSHQLLTNAFPEI